MKIIQVPFCFYPDAVGGTEVYVAALSRHLQQQGMEVLITAPGKDSQSYLHHQLRVCRFAVSNKVENLRKIYGAGDSQAASEFNRILETEQPDLVHLHAFTSGASLRLVQAAKQRQIPVVFTYHTPTVSCQRGTLMQWGRQICKGKVDLHTCAQCTLQGLGLDETSAKIIGNLPPQLGQLLGNWNLQGGGWTALRMTELINLRHTALYTLLSQVDHIVAVCQWVKDVLLLNHVPLNKITVIRQGLSHDFPKKAISQKLYTTPTLKVVFLGRLDPTKGIHILIRALKALPQFPISLDIYGVSQGVESDVYQQELQTLTVNDSRISFKPPVSTAQVTATIENYDLLAVPSQWLETGPMVVLEAFAVGVPVIGSNLGGIAELVQSEVNGILVEPNSIEAWTQALQRLCQDRKLLKKLSTGIYQPQSMVAVAKEMQSIYLSLKTKKS
ncbi:MAG: glycosyltransferase family 4 protein [Goleter apudmare HA4340-LM2]|jgi:glycosyltransferase involved in cell wall biosynthesis|nr:glycosyltransferase family 4 protein [Goleter apudmare HA4340-LM2]